MKFSTLLLTFSFIVFSSCFSDRDDNLEPDPDVAIDEPVPLQELIAEDSELFSLMETLTNDYPFVPETVCIDFVYSFTVVIYDEEGFEVSRQVVSSDFEFNNLLKSVPEEYFINLSFPIIGVLEDGSTFEVNNKEELQMAIEQCVSNFLDEVIGYCEGIAIDCAWVVTLPEDADPDFYENSVFVDLQAGQNIYYHRGISYNSSWIFYFIADKLHLNIALEDEEDTGLQWNYDWELDIIDEVTLFIQNSEGQEYILVKECEDENYCTELVFTECELTGQPDIAEFLLEEYIPCIDIMAAPFNEDPLVEEVEYVYTFYLNELDADAGINAIDTSAPFMNTEDPQLLYVRIEDPETGDYTITEITLEVESCT